MGGGYGKHFDFGRTKAALEKEKDKYCPKNLMQKLKTSGKNVPWTKSFSSLT